MSWIRRWLPALPFACALSMTAPAAAQVLPSRPIEFADGHAAIGADVSGTIAADDHDPGFFNYTDYEYSAVRLFQIALTGSFIVTPRLAFLAEVHADNLDDVQIYALYARIRPWTNRRFDIQVGRVPPTFGRFARETYASDNILIGYPLAYQYLTSLRPDSLPATANDLLRMRGRGWLSVFPIGNTSLDRGVPLVSAFRWDTGVQVHAASDIVEGTASVTLGTLSDPRVQDNNGGKQFAARGVVRPVAGLVIGGSFAHGAFISDSAARAVPSGAGPVDADSFAQTAWGADVEYSMDHYLVRAETVWSQWRVPMIATPAIDEPLRALAVSVEGKYRILPDLYVAARADHLGFSDVTGSAGALSWDAPVSRVEVGGGYSIQRNLVVKLTYQYNTRDGGVLRRTQGFPAAQVVYWF
jgi:hypothetical protein